MNSYTEIPRSAARMTGEYINDDGGETFMLGMLVGGIIMFLMCMILIFPFLLALKGGS